MGAVVLLSAAIGLALYGALLRLPRFSPRQRLVSRLGHRPLAAAPSRISDPALRRAQAWLAGGGLLISLAPWLLLGTEIRWGALMLYTLLPPLGAGAWFWLRGRRREALLSRAYPDLLAHLVAQARAGAGTFQAFATAPPVLREPLRQEVEELIADMRIAPFPAALGRFAQRCGIPEVRAFAANAIYQQSLGIALREVLESEEAHILAMARQAMRQRIQRTSITMAAVTVILLLNGLLIYMLPVVQGMYRLAGQP